MVSDATLETDGPDTGDVGESRTVSDDEKRVLRERIDELELALRVERDKRQRIVARYEALLRAESERSTADGLLDRLF